MIGKFQFLRSLVLSKKVNKKIIVIESDDWGSERIPNSEVREELATLRYRYGIQSSFKI